MNKSFSPLAQPTQTENVSQQVLKVLAGKESNAASIKFISQLQIGKVLDAVFIKNLPGGKGVLSLEGNKVVVKLPQEISLKEQSKFKDLPREPLIKGQKMTVRVENTGSKAALKIFPFTSQPNIHKNVGVTTSLTSRGKTISRFSGLESSPSVASSPNGVSTARVTSIVDSKTIMVEAGGKNFEIPVEKAQNFKIGSKVNILFEKTENGQKPVLAPTVTNQSKQLDFNTLKPYLPARMPIGEMAYLLKHKIVDSPLVADLQIKPGLITRLHDTLRLLLPNDGEIPNATKIRQQVESSGINYEARVRQVLGEPPSALARKELGSDLKGLLLEIYNSTETTSSNKPQKSSSSFIEFRNTLKYAIDNIELNQLSSQISKQENQPLVIQIPNPLGPANKTLQLFVRNDSSEDKGGNKNSSKKHNVAFFLDLSFLGKIKINAQMGPEQLSVSIDVENEDIAGFIRDRTKDFEGKMIENDITASVECYVSKKVEPEKDNLVGLLINHNTSLINIKT